MISILRFLLLTIIFLIPLIPASNNLGYEQIKVFFFIASLTIIGFLWLIYSLKHPVKIIWSPIQKAATLFIIILFITSFLGINKWNSFLGTQVYFQGWILYAYLYLFFLLVSWSKIKLEHLAYVLAGSSSIVGIIAIEQWVLLNVFHQAIPSYAGRVVSTFGQPNFYAGYILMCLPFFYYLLNKKNNWLLISGFLISILGLVISGSRIAYLGVAALLFIWLIKEFRIKKSFILISLTICLLALASSFYLSSGILWKEIISPNKTTNPDLISAGVEKRFYIWQVMGELIIKSPWKGYGLENISVVFSNYFITNKHLLFEENLQIKPFLFGLKDLTIDRSHNYILDLLLFSGILGLISWIVLVAMLFKKLFQNVLMMSLITYLIWIQFQNQSVVHLVYFWLLVGLINRNSKNLAT